MAISVLVFGVPFGLVLAVLTGISLKDDWADLWPTFEA
jgi:hypothetical protein